MTVAIKICGITTPEIWDHCLSLNVEYLGLMLYPPSPRAVSLAEAGALRRRPGSDRANVVAVTVDADHDLLAGIVETVRPDLLQCHGRESPATLQAIKARFGLPIIKALPIADQTDFAPANEYADVADLLLFDAKPAPGDSLPGGNARAFRWNLLAEHTLPRPWFLAGGLNPDSVAEAVHQSGARKIDLSSGVEVRRGVKSADKITALVETVRSLGMTPENG